MMDIRSLLAKLPVARFKEPPPTVGVLRLAGVIGGLGPLRPGMTLAALDGAIERAFKLRRLKAVALSVNSPG
ncbi:MAG: S49 family peptidase, partial [Kiloniellales bacterium]